MTITTKSTTTHTAETTPNTGRSTTIRDLLHDYQNGSLRNLESYGITAADKKLWDMYHTMQKSLRKMDS